MKGDKKQILVCGNYGAGNLGDEAILDGLISLCSSVWPNSHLTVMSSKPSATAHEHKITTVNLFPAGFKSFFKFWFSSNCLRTLKAVGTADLIILGGGGLFSDEKWQAVLIWFVQTWWFWLLGKRIVCLAQSIGPLHSKWAKFITARVFSRALVVTVRDTQSANILAALKIKKVKVLADPAFALGYGNEKASNVQDQVVLSLRPWKTENENFYRQIADTVEWLWHEHKLKTVFIPFQKEIDDDRDCYRQVRRFLEHQDIMEMKEVADYKTALEIIGRSRLVIGMRLHAIIFSVLGTRPFVAIAYSSKVRNFVADLAMEKFLMEYGSIDSSGLQHLLSNLLKETKQITDHLNKEKMQNTYRFFEHEKELNRFL